MIAGPRISELEAKNPHPLQKRQRVNHGTSFHRVRSLSSGWKSSICRRPVEPLPRHYRRSRGKACAAEHNRSGCLAGLVIPSLRSSGVYAGLSPDIDIILASGPRHCWKSGVAERLHGQGQRVSKKKRPTCRSHCSSFDVKAEAGFARLPPDGIPSLQL